MSNLPDLSEVIRHCDTAFLDEHFAWNADPVDIADKLHTALRKEVLNQQDPEDQETLEEAAVMYRSLRPVIERTMVDSDRWDGDEDEAFHLGRYVEWLAAERAQVRDEIRNEAADWFESYPFPSSDSDWERGRDDALAWVVRTLRNPDPQRGTATGQGLDARLTEHAAEVVAARDAQIIQWLSKKAREFHAASRKAERAQGDTCAVLASQIARGAVRPNNLRMLPNAGFFEVDHTYTNDRGFRFECHAVAPTPWDGTPRAIGYLTHPDGSGHVHGMTGEQWTDGDWDDTTEDARS